MTETQRRIKAYQKLLPQLRERVMAVALLLAMSVSMLSSASFAWLTLSRHPEVTAVNTTVAANGNLEIALASGDAYTIAPPADSQVGDSSAAEGQSVAAANITWGNLVNLADPSYGLDKMVLRPAQLNKSSLLDSPLYGATYGTDGRTDRLSSEFVYATWEPKNEAIGRMEDSFVISDKLGVRAITSTVSGESSEYQLQFLARKNAAEDANRAAGDLFDTEITGQKTLMGSLASVMGVYLTDNLNDTDSELDQLDVVNLGTIFSQFIRVYEQQIDAMVKLANYQLFVLNEGKTADYTEYTRDDLLKADEKNMPGGVKLRGLNQMKTDYQTLIKYYSGTPTASNGTELENMSSVAARAANGEKIKYGNIEHIVNALVNISQCEIVAGGNTYKVGNVGVSNALSILRSEGEKQAIITNGILKNFQQLNGREVKIDNMKVTVTYMVTLSIEADISTNAKPPYYYAEGLQYAADMNTGGEPVVYSEDTYGLAIDLWLRTNAPNSYLTLEGNVLTETKEVPATIDVAEEYYTATVGGENLRVYPIVAEDETVTWYNMATGEEVNVGNETPAYHSEFVPRALYTLTVTATDGSGEEYSYILELYQKTDADDNVTWYNAANHQTVELTADQEPKPKMEVIETVLGYEGVNRVWNGDEHEMISSDATTQGSGSCYVYYADTPEDQARSLALLESFKVAFVNDEGKLLATASMDTEHHYAATGRVIVPLKLDETESIQLEDKTNGKLRYAITALEKNEPTRITALVYLDGTKLYNENVLAAADIQGRLNIQFGTSEEMKPVEDLDLSTQIRTVSASLDKTEFDNDADDTTVNVTVKVDGDSPSSVTAFFLREINSTQGSREETMTFTQNEAGEWISSYTFTSPGKYVLRSVQLDGIEYDLPAESICRATVAGFGIKSLQCEEAQDNHLSVMTTETSQKVNLRLEFATDDVEKMPTTVQGRYLRTDGASVNVDFTRSGTEWKGSATFLESGDYTMQYLVLDGNYSELPVDLWQTVDLTMGMRVNVITTTRTNFQYDPDDETLPESLDMRVKILDGEGAEQTGLVGTRLYYSMAGSTQKLMAHLTWDPNLECYTGSFPVRVGNYSFSYVEVGKNILRNANADAPIFRINPNDPPAFTGDVTPSAQVVIGENKTATMRVTIAHSEAASVKAVLVKRGLTETVDGITVQKTFTVEGDLDTTGIWNFPVPKITSDGTADAENGTQDGYWTIQELQVYNAYDPTGNAYTEANPLVFNAQSKEVTERGGFVESKVISNAYVSLETPDKWNAHLGAESYTENGQTKYRAKSPFLTSHTVTGLKAYVTDFEGLPLDNDALKIDVDVQMDYNYVNQSSGTYGGYTSQQINNSTESKTGLVYTETKDANGATYFVLNETVTADQAGTYNADVSYTVKVNGNTVGTYHVAADNAKAFNFNVYSVGPTVKVTGTDPAPGTEKRVYTVSEPIGAGQLVQGDFFRFTDYTAAVYIWTPISGGGLDQEAAEAFAPTVSLQLSGVPAENFTGASMYFETKNENSNSSTFNFGTDMKASATIGKAVTGTRGALGVDDYPECYSAGKMTQNQITLTYGAENYKATLTNEIVIDQPQSPTVLQFTNIPTTYQGERPAQVIGEGTTVITTLPEVITWTAETEEPVAGATWSAYTAVGTDSSRRLYTIHSSGGRGKVYDPYWQRYQYYDWTTFQSECTAEINYYQQDMIIDQWEIDGETYSAGEKINITGEGILTAKAKYRSTSDKKLIETKESTTYSNQYGYVEGTLTGKCYQVGGLYVGGPDATVEMVTTAPDIANASKANASTNPVTTGTNMTTDSTANSQYKN